MPQVVEWLRALKALGGGSIYVFPKRRHDKRKRCEHVSPETIDLALKKLDHGLDAFTVHDFRRTARTRLAALGVRSVVAERCLGHKLRGVEGIYHVHDYYEERRETLEKLTSLLLELDRAE